MTLILVLIDVINSSEQEDKGSFSFRIPHRGTFPFRSRGIGSVCRGVLLPRVTWNNIGDRFFWSGRCLILCIDHFSVRYFFSCSKVRGSLSRPTFMEEKSILGSLFPLSLFRTCLWTFPCIGWTLSQGLLQRSCTYQNTVQMCWQHSWSRLRFDIWCLASDNLKILMKQATQYDE